MKCPFSKEECIKEECQIYANVYEGTCDIVGIAIDANEIKESMEQVSP
jgi:hypothetical protein